MEAANIYRAVEREIALTMSADAAPHRAYVFESAPPAADGVDAHGSAEPPLIVRDLLGRRVRWACAEVDVQAIEADMLRQLGRYIGNKAAAPNGQTAAGTNGMGCGAGGGAVGTSAAASAAESVTALRQLRRDIRRDTRRDTRRDGTTRTFQIWQLPHLAGGCTSWRCRTPPRSSACYVHC